MSRKTAVGYGIRLIVEPEIEDLLPADMIVKAVDAVLRAADKLFADVYKAGSAIVPQVESWCGA